jgi:uncharacterized protein (TIGR04255 family)
MPDLFPNAPLARAILEARFAGETAIEQARTPIQQEIRGDLPQLFVPRFVRDMAPALQAYVFQSADGSESFEVAINRIAYVRKSYAGYADFRNRALYFFGVFQRLVPQVRALNRVGLRYVNHIPMLRESPQSAIRLDDYVNIGLSLPSSIPSRLTELNSVFSVALDGGTLRVLLKNEAPTDTFETERLLLDFDFGQEKNLNLDGIDGYLELAHRHTKQIFLDLISPKYLPVLRGEDI